MKYQFYHITYIFLIFFIYKSETSTLRHSKESILSLSSDNQASSKYTLQISLCYSDFTPSSTYDEATGSEDSPTDSSISTEESTPTTETTTTTVITTESTTESTIESTADTEYDDDSDDLTVIDKYKEDNEEILTTNKKIIRLLSDYNIDGVDMKNIINETVNEYYLLNKVSIISTTISIISDDNNKTLKITVDLVINNKYSEISIVLEEYININKNNTFYNILSNKCNNIYTLCSNDDDDNTTTTTTIIPTTNTPITIKPECVYPSKSIFIYGSGNKTLSNNNTIIITTDGIIITYSSSSSKDCNIDINSGNITIDTNSRITEGFIKCIITCRYIDKNDKNNVKDGVSILQYKITTYKPSPSKLLSSLPYNIYPNEEFDVKLVLLYPFISDLTEEEQQLQQHDLNIALKIYSDNDDDNNNKYMLQNGPIYKISKTIFEYNDLIITNSTDEILKEDDDKDDDDDDENKISFQFMNESTNIFTSDKITIKNTEKCNKDERDKMGLCCENGKESINGIMCKNLTFIIPFINSIDDLLYKTYYHIFGEIIFNNTNYLWYSFIEEYNRKSIIVKININNIKLMRLLSPIEKDDNYYIFDNYEYIKSVLSIFECIDEIEINERINILPNDIKEIIINSKLDSKIKTSIKEINKVNEETGNRIDYNIGITSVFNYKPEEKEEEKEKDPWYKEYIYLIVIVGIVVLLIIVVFCSVLLAYISQVIEQKKMNRNEVVTQNVIPIEKIKQNNNYSDDIIYRPNSQKIIMEGYLMKENTDRMYDKFQRRYCILYSNPTILRIYGSMTPNYYGKVYLDEKQNIPLECYNGIEYEEGSNEFTLKLKIRESYLMTYEPGDKEIKISFKVDDELENSSIMAKEWVENIKNYKNEKPIVSEAWNKPAVVNEEEDRSSTEYYKPEVLERAKTRKQQVRGGMEKKRTVTIKQN